MVLLDYVGNKGLRLPREGDVGPRAVGARSAPPRRRSARREFFPDGDRPSITDDHTPFLRAGIPAVDLIDWSYPGHTLEDGLDKLSAASLDAVGETVTELVFRLRSGARIAG